MNGYNAATVWTNGTWFTWDRCGAGGENSKASTIVAAQLEAEAAVRRQGFFDLNNAAPYEVNESLDGCTNCAARRNWAETPRADKDDHREAHATWRRGRRVA